MLIFGDYTYQSMLKQMKNKYVLKKKAAKNYLFFSPGSKEASTG